ncbi:DUF397 domain-containing protein [Catenulispora sp. NF23]|uniref:DUF397 domain-containing protein n=1 Tax=Catenulispora pinistramenti TaxID=2705254 RepID=UPI001BA918A7|nr:DUF397 domain-containing protein [Catenulispora pinistramenti]MBS2533870.1 DUF397 domain-containing protein [Catenulispora pinistramenti]
MNNDTEQEAAQLVWRKSSFSNGQGGQCVETAALPDGGRFVRNSKDPNGPAVQFTAAEWSAFVSGVKAGEDL